MRRSLNPVTLNPQPSRRLTAWLIALYGFTFTVFSFAPLPPVVRMLLYAILLILGGRELRRQAADNPGRITELRLDAAGRLRLQFRDGRMIEAELRPDSLIGPGLVVLRYTTRERRLLPHSLLLAGDSVTPREMRRLRVLLKYGLNPAG